MPKTRAIYGGLFVLFVLICGLIYWHVGLLPALIAGALYYGAWELTCYRIRQINSGDYKPSIYDYPHITAVDHEEDALHDKPKDNDRDPRS